MSISLLLERLEDAINGRARKSERIARAGRYANMLSAYGPALRASHHERLDRSAYRLHGLERKGDAAARQTLEQLRSIRGRNASKGSRLYRTLTDSGSDDFTNILHAQQLARRKSTSYDDLLKARSHLQDDPRIQARKAKSGLFRYESKKLDQQLRAAMSRKRQSSNYLGRIGTYLGRAEEKLLPVAMGAAAFMILPTWLPV